MMNRIINSSVFNNRISATRIKNIIHNDPILVILENHKDLFNRKPFPLGVKLNMQMGIEYENDVIENIRIRAEELGLTYDYGMNQGFFRLYDRNIRTCKDIDEGIDIITQGALYKYNSPHYVLQGIPDIIISNRALGLLFPYAVDEYQMNSPGYSIIEIKNCSIHCNTKGNIDNSNKNMVHYKAQTIMYLDMLMNTLYEDIYEPANIKCYIMGKQMKLGEVSPTEIVGFRKETIVELYQRCVREYLQVNSINIRGSQNPLHELCRLVEQNPLLGPNMSNRSDGWDHIKKEIAMKTFELSLLPSFSIKKKHKLFNEGITSWKDPRITAEILRCKNTPKNTNYISRVNALMDLHRFSEGDVYTPRILKPMAHQIISRISPIETFLDFETVYFDGSECIVQIGTLVVGPDFNKYHSFMVNKINIDEELIIIKNWLQMMTNYQKQYGIDTIPIYHWTRAEVSFINRFIRRLSAVVTRSRSNIVDELNISMDNFKDLAQAYINCPVIIRGVFGYSIKPIVKALYSLGHIPETWEDENIDGFGASLLMLQANKECIKNRTALVDTDIAQNIIKYNKIDCQSVYNLLSYIRSRYSL